MAWRFPDYALAASSGLLLALSFPKFGHPAFAWIALTPLLIALTRQGGLARSFGLGVVAGVVYFCGTIYWLTRVMVVYGGLPFWVAAPVNALFIAYLALFPALFAVIVRRLVLAHGTAGLLTSPLVWVATELGRTYLFTGFPWVLLGYSQAKTLAIAQFASLFGVYGVSALVVGANAATAHLVVETTARGDRARARAAWVASGAIALGLFGVAIWGGLRAARAEWTRAGQRVHVGVVQGNVEPLAKLDSSLTRTILGEYLENTRRAVAAGSTFVVWPESATPFLFEQDRVGADQIKALARQLQAAVLFGSDQFERGTPNKYYNAAYAVDADGAVSGPYRKMHLVPFGEYVPRPFFYAGKIVEAVSDFSAGSTATLLLAGGHPVSVAICYEIIYPALVREFVRGGTELLTTITNDAWFGPTSAPYQHFDQASMRAIEEGRYLVRSANTGISGLVDPYGHVLVQTGIFQPAVIDGEVRFLTVSTFYARHGDIFAYASVVVAIAMLALARRRIR